VPQGVFRRLVMVRNAILVREKALSFVAVTWHFLSHVVVSPHPCWSGSSSHCFVLLTKSPRGCCSVRCSVSAPSLPVAFPGCTWICRNRFFLRKESSQRASVGPGRVSQRGSSKPCPGGALLIALLVLTGSRRARCAPTERSVAMPMARTS